MESSNTEKVLVGCMFALVPAAWVGAVLGLVFGWEAGLIGLGVGFGFGIDVLFFGKKR